MGRVGCLEPVEFGLFQQRVGFLVRDALVTVDAGLPLIHGEDVLLDRALLLVGRVHGIPVMAVAAFPRVGVLHGVPDIGRHAQAVVFEFFRGIDGAQGLVQQFVAGLDLAHHLVHPGIGYVTIGTSGAYAAAIGVMNGMGVLLVDVFFHFMAGNTERQGIGSFHGGVEATPEHHADDHEKQRRADGGTEQHFAGIKRGFLLKVIHDLLSGYGTLPGCRKKAG